MDEKTSISKTVSRDLVRFLTFAAIFVISIVFMIVPIFEIKFEYETGDASYLLTLFNAIFGGTFAYSDDVNAFEIFTKVDGIGLTALILLILGGLIYLLTFFFKELRWKNVINIVSTSILSLSLVLFLIMPFTFSSTQPSISTASGFDEVEVVQWAFLGFLALLLVLVVLNSSEIQYKKAIFTTQDLAEMGALVALAIVLDKLKIDVNAGAGSINLSALPLMIFAARRGFLKGLFASSVIFAILSCIIDGYGIQTLPFDYIIAFSGYATVGLFYKLFKKTKIDSLLCLIFGLLLGGVVSFITRMGGSTISSMVLYEYSFVDAFLYNITYIPLSVFGSMILGLILAAPISAIERMYPAK